ncbi:hypothetical protein C8R44DRAFT_852977, partial [Mycena epipterygia]
MEPHSMADANDTTVCAGPLTVPPVVRNTKIAPGHIGFPEKKKIEDPPKEVSSSAPSATTHPISIQDNGRHTGKVRSSQTGRGPLIWREGLSGVFSILSVTMGTCEEPSVDQLENRRYSKSGTFTSLKSTNTVRYTRKTMPPVTKQGRKYGTLSRMSPKTIAGNDRVGGQEIHRLEIPELPATGLLEEYNRQPKKFERERGPTHP